MPSDEEEYFRRRFVRDMGSLSLVAFVSKYIGPLADVKLLASNADLITEDTDFWIQSVEAALFADGDLDLNANEAVQNYLMPEKRIIQEWAEDTEFESYENAILGREQYKFDWGFEAEYVHDEDQFKYIEYWQGPIEFRAENDGRGDCEDWMIYSLNIAEALGLNARGVLGTAEFGDNRGGHAYTEIEIDGEIYVSDVNSVRAVL